MLRGSGKTIRQNGKATRGRNITLAARVSFPSVDRIRDRMKGVDFPIGLAMPHQYGWWQEAARRMGEMLECLDSLDLTVATVHAVQAPISDRGFPVWGRQTVRIAQHVGARTITVHPNRARNSRGNHQFAALQSLRGLQRETNVAISVETFGGKDRVFRPEDIISRGLPMTLDIAHLADNERIMRIVDAHWRNIPVVHLSARGSNYWGRQPDAPLSDEGRCEHHLPVDPFCIGVVRKLVGLGWSGAIVLEYLPWYHYRLRGDVKLVNEALRREVAPGELPPPCDAYRGMYDKYGHNAPPPEGATSWPLPDH